MQTAFDGIWIEAAARLGIPVERGGDAYVHWDGRVLHLATDEHLDDDDTVAQLVLHEICHALVQGPARFRTPDWGLDNTSNDDDAAEAAAVRLQAHLAGAFGLRKVLFPTTVVRAFFERLPEDAFAVGPGLDGESASLAREAARRAVMEPFDHVLIEALRRTTDEVARGAARSLAPGLEWRFHRRVPLPLLDEAAARRTCGGCAFRSAGGLCRKAPARRFVHASEPACVRWEGPLDCLACGACCRSAYGSVPVTRRDRITRAHPELVVARQHYLELRRSDESGEDRCAALEGPAGGPFRCGVYEDRPRPCRDFEPGGRHCIEARRRVGLSF